MPDGPLVSIVTPSFNQGEFLAETLQSVIQQDYPLIEYLIMDGGSNDNSARIIESFAQRFPERIVSWESAPDRGQAHAINKGLQRARGEILGWLNADDLLLPGTASRVVEAFTRRPEIDVVYGRLERINAAGQMVPTPVLPKDRVEFGLQEVVGECIVNQPGSFWRRRVMDRAGWLDESLRYTLDYEWWIRLALLGAQFVKLPEVVARFRLSPHSKTVGETAAMAREQLQVLERLLAQPGLAERTGLSPEEIVRRARITRAAICLHAFYGSVKIRRWGEAWGWLADALKSDPAAPFKRRWVDLAWAGLARRIKR